RLKRARSHARYQPKPGRTAFVWLGERRKQIPVYNREELRPGAAIKGPAIIVEYGSTTLAPAGGKVRGDGWKNLVLDEQIVLARRNLTERPAVKSGNELKFNRKPGQTPDEGS